MVGRSINDWYHNAEGHSSDTPGLDWENDDRPDRTPDAWLDRVHTARSAANVAKSTRQRDQDSPTVKPADKLRGATNSVPAVLTAAIRELRLSRPGITDRTLARRLRERGWTTVTEATVRATIQGETSTANPARSTRAAASPGGTTQRQPARQQRATTPEVKHDDGRTSPGMRVAIQTLRRRTPGIGAKKIVQRLRQQGWPDVTQADVRAALAPPPPPPRIPPDLTYLATSRTLTVPPVRADACAACGVVVSDLGTCRCS